MMKTTIITRLLLVPGCVGLLHAGTPASPPAEFPAASVESDGDWEITLGLYAWAAGLDGTLGAAGFTTDVDLSFSDILDTLDMTAMGFIELRKDRWLLQFEGLYLRNSAGVDTITPAGASVSADLTAETTRLELVGGYTLLENDRSRLDLLAGLVYYDISNELDFTGPAGAGSAKSGDEWLDPVVGLRYSHFFNDRWSAVLRGEIGGFGVNADLVWQAVGTVGYRINDTATAHLGYRHAAVDYQNGGFTYDVASSGPVLGVTFNW